MQFDLQRRKLMEKSKKRCVVEASLLSFVAMFAVTLAAIYTFTGIASEVNHAPTVQVADTVIDVPTVIVPVAVTPVVMIPAPMINLSGTDLEAVLKTTAMQAGIRGNELAAFMSQSAHETMNFVRLVEVGTVSYFRRYDPVHAPNRARNLGNTRSGDGFRYRGRGYIQLTGRYNYQLAGTALDLPLVRHPELAEDPHIAAEIAVWYWNHRVRPRVTNFADVRSVTRPINPGLNGLADRRVKFRSYQTALL